MNVLLTCAGRRNYLVQYFAEALDGKGKVFAADSSRYAPALEEAAVGFVVPSVDEPRYFEHLLGLCRDNQVSLLVPLNDLELPLLSRQRERFLEIGTTPLVSSPEIIDTCFDKWETVKFLKDAGIDGPSTYPTIAEAQSAICSGELQTPFIIKPRWGSASICIETVFDKEDIGPAHHMVAKRVRRSILANAGSKRLAASLLFQEHLDGQEYGLDVINDLSGRYLHTFVRRKLGMRAGETDRAIAIRDRELEALGERIGRALGHSGIVDCDVFDCAGRLSVLEMNPRFGGGYPFTHMAGANLPAILIALANGKVPDPDWFSIREGTCTSKCERLVVMEGDLESGTGSH